MYIKNIQERKNNNNNKKKKKNRKQQWYEVQRANKNIYKFNGTCIVRVLYIN